MKVLFDHQIFTNQLYGGISRYFYELILELKKRNYIKTYLSSEWSNNAYLLEGYMSRPRPFFQHTDFRGKPRIMEKINKYYSLKRLKQKDYDIFHPTYYDPYFISALKNKPFVITCYDLIQEKFPKFHKDPTSLKLLDQKKKVLERATCIISISESTKKDIVQYYGIDENKIEVIYLASSLGETTVAEKHKVTFPERYLLFVGNRTLYKNFIPYVKAITDLLRSDASLNLVCAGGGELKKDELELFTKLGIPHQVRHYRIDDTLLAQLYRNATAFAFPSLYEGFGIPVLEAFGCGCPVLLSRSSSLPEVAGEAALYFNPEDDHSMYTATKQMLSNENIRREAICKGYKQFENFSWEKTAIETEALYKRLIQ